MISDLLSKETKPALPTSQLPPSKISKVISIKVPEDVTQGFMRFGTPKKTSQCPKDFLKQKSFSPPSSTTSKNFKNQPKESLLSNMSLFSTKMSSVVTQDKSKRGNVLQRQVFEFLPPKNCRSSDEDGSPKNIEANERQKSIQRHNLALIASRKKMLSKGLRPALESPLMIQIKEGNIQGCLRILDEPGGTEDVNEISSEGLNPLYFAVNGGHQQILELLISKSVDLNQRYADGQTALMMAAKK